MTHAALSDAGDAGARDHGNEIRYEPERATLVAGNEVTAAGRGARASEFQRALDDLPLVINLDLGGTRNAYDGFADEIAELSVKLMRQARTLVVTGADAALRSELEAKSEWDLGIVEFDSGEL